MVHRVTREWRLEGDIAVNYETYFVPAIFRPWATILLDLAQPQPGEHLLDVATGTGVVARLATGLVGPAGAVTGLDLNPAMLAVAVSATPEGTSIEWKQGSANSMPFADEAFDVVVCQQGLQFFPNKLGALKEMHRVLKPGGRLTASVWRDVRHIPGYEALTDALCRHVSDEAGSFFRMVGSLGDANEFTRLIEAAGFEDARINCFSKMLAFASVEAFVWEAVQTTPLAWMGAVTQADDVTRETVVQEMECKLQPYINSDGLSFPIEANIATARRGKR